MFLQQVMNESGEVAIVVEKHLYSAVYGYRASIIIIRVSYSCLRLRNCLSCPSIQSCRARYAPLKVVRPALLLGPQGLVVALSMGLELDLVGVHDLAAAVLALYG